MRKLIFCTGLLTVICSFAGVELGDFATPGAVLLQPLNVRGEQTLGHVASMVDRYKGEIMRETRCVIRYYGYKAWVGTFVGHIFYGGLYLKRGDPVLRKVPFLDTWYALSDKGSERYLLYLRDIAALNELYENVRFLYAFVLDGKIALNDAHESPEVLKWFMYHGLKRACVMCEKRFHSANYTRMNLGNL
jgi:hypothetical protein